MSLMEIEPYIFSDAVRDFWETRSRQAEEQKLRGVSDQGSRSAVTGGRQMDGFIRKISELMISAGVRPEDIYGGHRDQLVLPGFFRPAKGWDMLVVSGGKLLVAIELKSHIGPSFSNNFNNRTEEAMGTALDIWTAYREGAFGLS